MTFGALVLSASVVPLALGHRDSQPFSLGNSHFQPPAGKEKVNQLPSVMCNRKRAGTSLER